MSILSSRLFIHDISSNKQQNQEEVTLHLPFLMRTSIQGHRIYHKIDHGLYWIKRDYPRKIAISQKYETKPSEIHVIFKILHAQLRTAAEAISFSHTFDLFLSKAFVIDRVMVFILRPAHLFSIKNRPAKKGGSRPH